MTPKQALETLEGVEHHGSLGEAGDTLLAVIRRDWAVRVLDAWAAENSCDPFKTSPHNGASEWHCTSAYENRHYARSPEGARHAAALAVFPTLPADVRAQLGECP